MRFSMKAISASLLTVGLLGATQASANELYFQLNPNYIGAGARQAFIFGAANATGSVTGTNGFNQIFDLGVSGFSVIDVPTSAELSNNTVENLGFKISSSTNISGYYLSRQDFTTDMSYLIDGDKLGTKYVVSTYAGSFDEQISVQATQDNTKVTFSLKTGETVVQTLNAGQTYMIARSQELTGSMVESDKPVAVLSGNACTNVPAGVPACDHIVEQMPSVASLSKEYYVAPTPRTGANGDVVRIVASENGTAVTVNGVPQGTLNAGEFKEIRITAGSNVVADKPVLVAQYLVGQNEAGTNTSPPRPARRLSRPTT
ncbi:MAG: IgGFc-binding protein [Zoogloea sp.]|nr:IgGFc-binding protein [Zoogloea sp.]